jgi:hypothetical protein
VRGSRASSDSIRILPRPEIDSDHAKAPGLQEEAASAYSLSRAKLPKTRPATFAGPIRFNASFDHVLTERFSVRVRCYFESGRPSNDAMGQ